MISYEIILIVLGWLVAAAVLGWLLPARWQMWAITGCGIGMIVSLSPLSLALLACGTAAGIAVAQGRGGRAAVPIFVTVVALVYGLFLLTPSAFNPWRLPNFVLPLGMAYYVLRLIHYVLEADRGRLKAHSWQEAVQFQFFPATLFVGPINRFEEFLRDIRRRRFDQARVSGGLQRILTGAVKIVVIANYLIADKLPALGDLGLGSVGHLYVDAILFWFKLYIFFSGYSDIAIGFGAVLGMRLPENFNWPFLAGNIGDFWRRWHITLSNWCRDYVHLPVLARWRRPAVATTASMLVLGLWHEASAHYLLWGLYHAAGLTVWRRFEAATQSTQAALGSVLRSLWRAAATLLTLHFVMFSYPVVEAIEAALKRV